ncbi:ChaN family lipoprotein [Desulfosarcina ovata]|uniref:ChaN family lipoprotein n=1 Tax=Desulfosarcina ovata TaxID=83564 RepID=UPI001391E46F|nr:ChaN family lipoprotein [Desulfosarcina ovata]
MQRTAPGRRYRCGTLFFLLLLLVNTGCAVKPRTLAIRDNPTRLMKNTILKTATGTVVSPEQLIAELSDTRVIYVGESHTNPAHHAIQLQIIKALSAQTPDLAIGMEMIDHTYQPVLDRWRAGRLDETTFLEQTHWYANWRYDFGLYRDILEYAKEKKLRLIALNIPFWIPPKISVGGIESLSEADRRQLPHHIDLTHAAHRRYVEAIFKMHAILGRTNFEFFYEAQCTWEDGMAAAVAANLGSGKMVVLAGNGHIIHKFGIPDRAFDRNAVPFKTIYLAPVGEEAELDWADYLWVTPQTPMPRMPHGMAKMKMPPPASD